MSKIDLSGCAPTRASRLRTSSGLAALPVVIGLAALIGVLIVLPKLLSPSASAVDNSAQAIAERIQPVGAVALKLEGGPLKTGEEVFKAQCSACHATGAAGSPKFGDAAAWGPRIATGFAALVQSALKGKGNMGAQGGGDISDFEIGRAVVYMANAAGGKFEEPKAPEAAASK